MTILGGAMAFTAAAYAAYAWPKGFRPYSETFRNMVLVLGIILLVWDMSIAITVIALEAGGLLVPGGFFEAMRIMESLVLIQPVVIIVAFGGAWLYLALLDRWISLPRTEDASST